MNEKINLNDIFESAMRDPSLFSNIDIDRLLDSIESNKNDYLENKTMGDITNNIYDLLNQFPNCIDICNKLTGYRHVDEINELHKGKHVRWIRISDQNHHLTNGGIVVDIKFLDSGTHVLCKNSMHRFVQYKFDDCITFQKMSVEEQLILMAYEHIDSTNTK